MANLITTVLNLVIRRCCMLMLAARSTLPWMNPLWSDYGLIAIYTHRMVFCAQCYKACYKL